MNERESACGTVSIMAERRATEPFRFRTCVETREPLGKRAHDVEELLAMIEAAPADCLVYHMQTCALRRPYADEEFPNDFAAWVAREVQDPVLGKRLGHLDPFAYVDLDRLRIAVLSIVVDHISQHWALRKRPCREPFEFFCSSLTEVDLRREAWTLGEFREALVCIEAGSLYLHACWARRRNAGRKDDFVRWLGGDEGLGLPELAAQVEKVGQLGLNLERKRHRILRLCDQALERP